MGFIPTFNNDLLRMPVNSDYCEKCMIRKENRPAVNAEKGHEDYREMETMGKDVEKLRVLVVARSCIDLNLCTDARQPPRHRHSTHYEGNLRLTALQVAGVSQSVMGGSGIVQERWALRCKTRRTEDIQRTDHVRVKWMPGLERRMLT